MRHPFDPPVERLPHPGSHHIGHAAIDQAANRSPAQRGGVPYSLRQSTPRCQPMDQIMSLLTDPATTRVAVVGASDSPGKWGGRAYRDLRAKGFQVMAVHPTAPTVADDPAYSTVADLPGPPDIVVFVVPPAVTLSVLEECRQLGYTSVWIQPGAGDDAVRRYLDEHGFDAVVDACILVETAA